MTFIGRRSQELCSTHGTVAIVDNYILIHKQRERGGMDGGRRGKQAEKHRDRKL